VRVAAWEYGAPAEDLRFISEFGYLGVERNMRLTSVMQALR
jgi:hypothetical protein